jgi:hypothetical protein
MIVSPSTVFLKMVGIAETTIPTPAPDLSYCNHRGGWSALGFIARLSRIPVAGIQLFSAGNAGMSDVPVCTAAGSIARDGQQNDDISEELCFTASHPERF